LTQEERKYFEISWRTSSGSYSTEVKLDYEYFFIFDELISMAINNPISKIKHSYGNRIKDRFIERVKIYLYNKFLYHTTNWKDKLHSLGSVMT